MRTRRSVYLAYLHTLAFALLVIGTILLVIRPEYAGHGAEAASSAVVVALSSLLLGSTLLAAVYRSRRLAVTSAIPLASLALLALATVSRPGLMLAEQLGLDSLAKLPPAFSAALVALLLAMVLQSWPHGRAGISRLFAVIALVMGVLSLLSVFSGNSLMVPLPDWDDFLYRMRFADEVEVTFNTSILTIMLGAGCLLLGSETLAGPVRLDRGTLVLGLLGTTATCFSWHLMHVQNLETDQARGDHLLASAHQSIQQQRLAHLELLNRITERWQTLEKVPAGPLWQHESASYFRDFPHVQLFAVLDAELEPLRVVTRRASDRPELQPYLTRAASRGWLEHTLASGEGHLGPLTAPDQSAALLASPLKIPEKEPLLVVAALDVEPMIRQQASPGTDDFIVRVTEQDRLLYASSPVHPESLILMGEIRSTYHHDPVWRIAVYMNRQGRLLKSAFLPPLLLFFGLGLTLLLMVSQRLAWESNRRNRQLDKTNLELGSSLAEQSRLREANQRIMTYSRDLLCAFDAHGRWTQVNPACRMLLGYEPDELIGQPFAVNLLAEDVASTEAAALSARRCDGTPVDFRNRYRRRDGSLAHLMWSGAWSDDEQELFCVARDITFLVATERREHDRQRILAMISTDQPLPDILEAVCRLGESMEEGTSCSLRLLDDESKILLGGAAPRLPASYTSALDGLELQKQSTLFQLITRDQRNLISADIANDPIWAVAIPSSPEKTFGQLATEHGLRAFWGIAVVSPTGQTLGSLATYRDRTGPPTEAQIEFISACGHLAAIALDRHRERSQLTESEQRYRSLFTYNPDPVYSMDRQGNFQSFNQAAAGLLGYTAAEVLGQHFAVALMAEERPNVRQHFAAALDGQAQHYHTRCQTREGPPVDLEVTNLPIVVNNQVAGVFGIAKDVTDRNRMIAALRERDQFFRLSLDMFFTLDEHGAFLQANPAFTRALGFEPGSLVGTLYTDLIVDGDKERVRQAVARLRAGHQVHHLEIQALGPSQAPRWLELNATADAGVIFCAARDVTERKETDQKLQRTMAELASSNEELERFAFVASHDLQEPLRKIQAFGERLQSRAANLDEQSQDYLQRMGSAAARMQTLIRDLLAYSRVSTRKEPFVALNMNQLVCEVLSDLDTQLRETGVEISVGQLPTLAGDPTQIRQVVQNLLSNAIKFRQIGGTPQIRVYAESVTATGWTLCFADNGIGFDEKYLDRIFDPFQRLHSRQAYPGTGIGLAIVAKVLERHDAAITAESTPGLGTTFRVRFTRT